MKKRNRPRSMCPVEPLIDEYERLLREYNDLDEPREQRVHGRPEPTHVADHIYARMKLVEAQATLLQARSFRGAMFQIVLAQGGADCVSSDLANNEKLRSSMDIVVRTMYSVINVLEAQSGQRLSADVRNWYMREDLNPLAYVQQVLKKPNVPARAA